MAKMTYQEAARILKECKDNESYPHIIKALEIAIMALERYEDLCEYFGGAKDILKNREDFKAWLGRVKWHIRKAEELYEKYEQEPCGDAISRTDLIRKLQAWDAKANGIPNYAWGVIKELPSVTPKEKTGHWIKHETYTSCSECGKVFPYCKIEYNFCPRCGARMESEE